MDRPLRVFLTRPPASHAAYRELAEMPPDGIKYSWMDGAPAPATGLRMRLATRALHWSGLPNFRPLRGGGSEVTDLVHSQQGLLLTSRPWVVDIEHGMPFVGIRFDRYRRALTRSLIRRTLAGRSCRAILPWTETAAQGFLATFGNDPRIRQKTRVVPPAVRLPVLESRRPSQSGCGVLFVANRPDYNFALKGGRELLLAFRELQRRYSGLRLTIVGSGPAYAGALAEQPNVQWLGVVDQAQMTHLYRDADVFVMPSFSDTFGMVFLEAMAFGLPVVALDRPYTRDIIRDGETGLLVRMGDASVHWCRPDGTFVMNSDVFVDRVTSSEPDAAVAAGVRQALELLVTDPAYREQLAQQARKEVATGRFSIAARNNAVAEVYAASVLERSGGMR